MRSTFFGIETGRRALAAHQRTQDVIGHNIANASTPGYSRQEAIIQTTPPIYAPYLNRLYQPGQIGTGNEIVKVKRYRDIFLDGQIRNGNDILGKQEVIYEALRQVEDIFNEPSEDGLNKAFSEFWAAWEELTKHPESVAVRTNVMETAVSLTNVAHKINFELRQLQSDYDTAMRQEIINVNIKASEIASLNEKIAKIKDLGDEANDLKDRRDLLVDELSGLINMNYFDTDRDQIAIMVGNSTLARDDYYFPWYDTTKNEYVTAAATRNEKTAIFSDILSDEHNLKVNVNGGKIGGYIYVRDVVIPDVLDMFDELMESFIIRVNGIHTRGYGLDGTTDMSFFLDENVQIPHTGVLHPTWDITYIGENQLPQGTRTTRSLADLGITAGTFTINDNVITILATDTLETALEKIESEAAVESWYDIEAGRVFFSKKDTVKPTEIQMDMNAGSSNFLEVLGFFKQDPITGVYSRTSLPSITSFHNSDTTSRFEVNAEIIANVNKIAASSDELSLPGDNTIALELADLVNQLTMSGQIDATATMRPTATFQEYFNALISKIGVDTQSAERAHSNQELILEEYEKRRTEAIGVSIDEELTKMIQAQKSFNSASRMISTVDEMLDRIINSMGLVGR